MLNNDLELDDLDGPPLPLGERRYYRRYPMGLEAMIEINGVTRPVTISDLSLGGAALQPGFPGLIGARVGLKLNGLEPATVLPGRILNVSKNRTHLLFDCMAREQSALITFLISSDGETFPNA